ncbi:MAG: MerR family transcriptional regulator [Mycobacterium sp.]
MRISELAARAGVSTKAVRYYEQLGLIVPARGANGYRAYTETHLRAVTEIRELAAMGVPPSKAAPFVECLDAGHRHGDDCPSSLAVYRDSIVEIDRIIDALTVRRALLIGRLLRDDPANTEHQETEVPTMPTDFTLLPPGLPEPVDDGRAAHLSGMPMPDLELPTSAGDSVNLARLPAGRSVIYLYPLTGRPGIDLPEGWDSIPGARGCSTEACNFRDHFGDLRARGVVALYGMSSQATDYQAEVVDRLHLPFPMLSDPGFALAGELDLPTFTASEYPRLYTRLTLIVSEGTIEHVFYPIFPPNTHAEQVLSWLDQHPK